jgi:hypothetical protein
VRWETARASISTASGTRKGSAAAALARGAAGRPRRMLAGILHDGHALDGV